MTSLFPKAKILRMDRDSTNSLKSYEEILNAMKNKEADILIGTQMIAKGHDLPNVTLVGIINSDIGLHLPDFRANERVFQLITQASGRAGRGSKPGKVLIQTREVNHPTIVATKTNRFKAFARYEMEHREKLNYPPYGKLMRLVISSTSKDDARSMAFHVKEVVVQLLEKTDEEISVLGPTPAHFEKLRSRYRWNILVKASSSKSLSSLAKSLQVWKSEAKKMPEYRLGIDIDPYDML